MKTRESGLNFVFKVYEKHAEAILTRRSRAIFCSVIRFCDIEKDAVLTPFNWDDLVQPSDVRGHKLFFSYTVDPRVTFNITGLFNKRLNGLLGPFGTTPAGSLDRSVTRLQFDTVFKF